MNSDKPVQLSQKIQFLHQKVDFMHGQIKQLGLFQLKIKFIQFIDTSIERLYQLDNKNYKSQVIPKKHQEYYHAEQNERERQRINSDRDRMEYRLKELTKQQQSLEVDRLKIDLDKAQILKERLHKEYGIKEQEMKTLIHQLQNKIKAQEREIQRLIKINSALAKELENIKDDRNRAEKRERQIRDKYQAEIGLLQTFDNKKKKYLFRNQEGLRILRTLTNVTTDKKGCSRLVLCDLPLKFHVIKIVYGIKVGVVLPNHQLQYFTQISLYQKEDMVLHHIDGILTLEYIKRRVNVKLQNYHTPKNQVIIMLFGKGDSVALDQSQ